MTYSHNTVKMTATTVNAHATKAARSSVGNGEGSSGQGGGFNKQYHSSSNRRTSPNQLLQQQQLAAVAATPTSGSAAYAFSANNSNNNVISHSNSIACSTNIQQHPLMGVEPSPPGTGGFLISTPTSGSNYFANQRKQQQQQQPRMSCGNDVNSSGGGTFFNKNNNNNSYAGQYFPNNNNNSNRRIINQKQQQLQQLQQQQQQQVIQQQLQQRGDQNQRTPNTHQARHSPAAVLGGGISGSGSASNYNIGGKSSGSKRRPKIHFQSPIVSVPCDLGVGGNISPTHPLLPAVLTHFAGSKCFDAPAPSAVPKPPQHWMQLDAAAIATDDNFKKMQQKTINNAGPGLKNIINAHNNAITLKTRSAAIALMGIVNNSNGGVGGGNGDMHTCGGHVVKSSKRNLLEDFDTHNLKLLLNVQS